jgi:hypothetical protein
MTITSDAPSSSATASRNVVGEDEAKELYLGYSVPGAGEPLFQAASSRVVPGTVSERSGSAGGAVRTKA